ncbi:antifreeze protein [Magnetospirillum sp. UT-4]|uniref:antifreeze protein n=1 Tax=Magnetospirillum sp. UT-4 TaxID=2681467 RepID=UPI00137CA8D4|nr:antifreeze protein [Magnetospirillum sp. UT-4]CAA7618693.1 conserved exported hypothetical protein [Magnetospirillum sp. UT-4]
MTVCRARVSALFLSALLLSGASAAAQGTGQVLPPVTPFDPETMERMDPPASSVAGPIAVDALKPPNPEAAGVLDSSQGGFPATLWAGTPAPVARALLPLLPGAGASATVRGLERRLLLTAAPPPEGARETDTPSLVGLRAERLMAMGDSENATKLAKAVPASATGPLLARLKAEAALVAGDVAGACADAARTAGPAVESDSLKLSVFCHFSAGNMLQGNLGLDLLRERKDPDQAFIAAAEVMAGLPPVPADKIQLSMATPLHMAAFSAARMALPPQSLAAAPVAVAQRLAVQAGAPPELRLAAAERAEAAGVLPIDSLRKLYLDMVFAPDEMATPLTKADGAGVRARALLFRAATDQPDPALKAKFAAKAVELAAAKGEVAAAARVFEAILWTIKPDPALAAPAPALARAMYALDRPEAAAKWLDMARADPAAKAADALWPLSAVAAAMPGQPAGTQGFAAWRATLAGLPPEIAARRTGVVLGVLAGLGAKVPEAAWLDTLALPTGGPKPGLFAMLQAAALDARLGGTVLAALAAIGDTPLDRLDVLTLSEAVSALAVVGLGDEARRLAVEALLANGV